ncbi:hypothetical protein KTS45_07760 [Halomicroarcula limicola]|uniref:DUF1102 domain-containing protein n=1 Tax=Haloarcula limicola TaxID=1429915 RepID=A0A8J7Y9D1_9EURY|nr:hypothetical protein [Halomicroarcula limicola]MBV0924099.1 hypothetical protein [Halomicroarcula limicola]
MKRRTLLAGLGSLTAANSLIVGSGAFTSISADRTINAEIADDNRALLAIHERGDSRYGVGGRSNESGDTVTFSFPGVGRRLNNDDPGVGLGVDSVYEFTQDSGEADSQSPKQGLARIQNQGTQSVEVYSVHETSSELEIELFDVTNPDRTALRDDPTVMNVGDHVDVGFRIRTTGTDLGTHDETLTIVAEATDD